jgi:hypothetical protein
LLTIFNFDNGAGDIYYLANEEELESSSSKVGGKIFHNTQ